VRHPRVVDTLSLSKRALSVYVRLSVIDRFYNYLAGPLSNLDNMNTHVPWHSLWDSSSVLEECERDANPEAHTPPDLGRTPTRPPEYEYLETKQGRRIVGPSWDVNVSNENLLGYLVKSGTSRWSKLCVNGHTIRGCAGKRKNTLHIWKALRMGPTNI